MKRTTPGSIWRVTAGTTSGNGDGMMRRAINIDSEGATVVDEFCLPFLHVERMDRGVYSVNLGDYLFNICWVKGEWVIHEWSRPRKNGSEVKRKFGDRIRHEGVAE